MFDWFVVLSIHKIEVTIVKGISQFLIYFFSEALPIHQKFIGKSSAEFIIQNQNFPFTRWIFSAAAVFVSTKEPYQKPFLDNALKGLLEMSTL